MGGGEAGRPRSWCSTCAVAAAPRVVSLKAPPNRSPITRTIVANGRDRAAAAARKLLTTSSHTPRSPKTLWALDGLDVAWDALQMTFLPPVEAVAVGCVFFS